MSFILLGILNSQAAAGGNIPASLNPDLWLDASDASTITESGGSVSQWDNKGTLENFTQATSADQPTTGVTTQNGLNVIDFAGDYLSGSTASEWKFLHDGTTYFFAGVMKVGNTATPGTNAIFGNDNESTVQRGAQFQFRDTDSYEYEITRGVSQVRAVDLSDNGLMPANTALIASALLNPDAAVAADRIDAFVNNTQSTVENTLTDAPSTSNPSFNLEIGASGLQRFQLNGFIAELIIVSGANATEENRQATVNYLNSKWGIF